MCNLNSNQYSILKKLYKSKNDTVQMDTNERDYKFLLYYKLIESEYISDGPFTNLEPSGKTNITNEGINKYFSYRIESQRHWQNIFIPQTLNIIVSMITTVITFFILKCLQG